MGARRDLAAATLARLKTIGGGFKVYESEPPATPPTISDNDLRVKPYLVFHPGSGAPSLEESQCDDAALGIDWTFQVTCVSGIASDVPTLVDAVDALIDHWQPISQASCGVFKQISNFNVMKERGETPARYVMPLIYRVPFGT